VFWSELDGLVLEEDKQGFIDRGRALARTHGIYLFMAVGEFRPGRSWMRNSLVGIDPRGEVISTYDKARPVPGDPEKPGNGEVVTLTTPFGRIAQAICYDMDFPWLVRQAGRAGADWMLVPARDWKEIDSLHARMAMVRGIENGFAVVRQARGGISMAADRHGRVLARADDAGGHDPPLVVQVPVRGARTVYARVGDVFAWLCMAALVLLIVRRRTLKGAPAPSGGAARGGSA
jgi:apolipoprotein N-acyltransferase